MAMPKCWDCVHGKIEVCACEGCPCLGCNPDIPKEAKQCHADEPHVDKVRLNFITKTDLDEKQREEWDKVLKGG